jgi:hypothetical protein
MYSEDIGIKEIRDLIIVFNADSNTQKLRKYYYNKTYAEILGVSRRELSHSSFIAWILKPNENHGLQDFALRRLFEIILSSRFFNEDRFDNDIIDSLVTSNYSIMSNLIETERALLKNFWESNEKLIMAALYAISSDPDQEKEVRENIENAIQTISSGR